MVSFTSELNEASEKRWRRNIYLWKPWRHKLTHKHRRLKQNRQIREKIAGRQTFVHVLYYPHVQPNLHVVLGVDAHRIHRTFILNSVSFFINCLFSVLDLNNFINCKLILFWHSFDTLFFKIKFVSLALLFLLPCYKWKIFSLKGPQFLVCSGAKS